MTVDKNLLTFWWQYYGKVIYTLAELQEFLKIIDQYGAEKVFDAVVASYLTGDGSPTTILLAIRKGLVKQLFDSLPDASTMNEDVKAVHQEVRADLLKEIREAANLQ